MHCTVGWSFSTPDADEGFVGSHFPFHLYELLIPSPRNALYFLYLTITIIVPYYRPFTLAPDAFNDDLEMYGRGIYLGNYLPQY